MSSLVPIKTALLSVSDKTDLVPFAAALAARGVRLISTGGTAQALAAAGLAVTGVDELTGFPEGLDGRVKTLHPKVHAGLLAVRDNTDHAAFLRAHGIEPIDLVCINLYPFQRVIADPDVSLDEAIENIDVGGPAMLRAGAKNHRWTTVVPSTRRYDAVISELDANNGCTGATLRSQLATETFAVTSEYDAAIAAYLSRRSPEAFPATLRLTYTKADDLRYGENPHQQAALYRDPASTGQTIVNARQLHGKQLSYNNINDASAALETVKVLALRGEMNHVAASVVKHLSPCGAAIAGDAAVAIDRAIAGDPLAAYGGILAASAAIDEPAAERLCRDGVFFEVVVAPEYSDRALSILRSRWANLRILEVGHNHPSAARKLDYRSVPGGLLVQDRDRLFAGPTSWTHVAGPAPTSEQLAAAAFLEIVCKGAMSNAVVIGGVDTSTGSASTRLFGLGGGQVDRLTSCRIAVQKAGALSRDALAVSDAFFPFPDGPEVLIEAGVRMIVHPGGSKRDIETAELCKSRGVTLLTTGVRHFRH
ncbi:MAG: bifunctional phosphoribosylaminoimidazolecarboxamide formyltransferase/IMP cyclohydrolase [Phycisphaeraceae bacterium]|nr:bifunctional phosphoribosylaminoimidazolecarboxamide formyltransferase/IMP cyclohydrolase [Phycisphaeraceae bacterium]